MIIDGKSYPDPEVEQLQHEIAMGMRREFVAKHCAAGKNVCFFVLSLESGRIADCIKDIRRGRVSIDAARHVLDDAPWYGVYVHESIKEEL